MKLFKTKLMFAGVLLSFCSGVFALPDITGNWKCTWYDSTQNKNASVSGEIKKTGDIYSLVNWKMDGSDEVRTGTGIHYDQMKNSLAIIGWSNNNSNDVGFGIYEIKSANKIVGLWASKNGKITSDETCERVKA